MKHLPFFKCEPTGWLTGKIQLCTHQEKGIFWDLCNMVWMENGTLLESATLHRKLRVSKGTLSEALEVFYDLDIMQEDDGFLSVKFLTEQLKARKSYIDKCRKSGRKGGRPKRVPQGKQRSEIRDQKADIRKQKADKGIVKGKEKPAKTLPKFPSYDQCKGLLPDGITEEAWNDYRDIRKHKKAMITDRVLKIIKNGLDQLSNPKEWFEYVVDRQWQGVFPSHKPLAEVQRMEVAGEHPFGTGLPQGNSNSQTWDEKENAAILAQIRAEEQGNE